MKKNEKSIACALFSPDRKKILLIKRRDVPVWVLPGGGVEEGESIERAALREMQEETGLKTKIVRLVGEYFPINRLSRHTFLFECALLEGHPSIGEETRAIQFFSLESLPKLLPPPYPEWIMDASLCLPPLKKELKSVNYRTLLKNFLLHPSLVLRFLLARLGFPINS